MKPLFEAKALYAEEYALYNIYRLEPEKYKAQLIYDQNDNYDPLAPVELVVTKQNGQWKTHDERYSELGSTIGIEIDVFNNGYGDILGRIGVG